MQQRERDTLIQESNPQNTQYRTIPILQARRLSLSLLTEETLIPVNCSLQVEDEHTAANEDNIDDLPVQSSPIEFDIRYNAGYRTLLNWLTMDKPIWAIVG
jgi:hypothetical protein